MIYAIYDVKSGIVKRSIECGFTPAESSLLNNEGIVEYRDGFDPAKSYFVVDGVPVPQPEAPMSDDERRKRAQVAINSEARAYLDSTDWYVTRFAETGVAIPTDITAARTAARASII